MSNPIGAVGIDTALSRITATFSEEISRFLEGEENRMARLVFPQAFNGAHSDRINVVL